MSTKIQWTDETWNPVRGCWPVSAGCANCYAMSVARRFNKRGQPYEGLAERRDGKDRWTGTIRLVPEKLDEPLRWREPRRVFVNSMSDLFHEDVPEDFLAGAFRTMKDCPQHIFQILTKRPQRMQWFLSQVLALKRDLTQVGGWEAWSDHPLPNVWLGVSVENQATADERIPILLHTPAAIRWVSYEPAIGPVDFRRIDMHDLPGGRTSGRDVLDGVDWVCSDQGECGDETERLNWLVVGGESGPGARAFNIQWARDTVQACQESSVACFVKQLGAKPFLVGPTGHHIKFDVHHSHGADPDEWPQDLRIRQYPEVSR